MRKLFLGLCVVGLLGLMGCGDGTPGDTGTGGGEIPTPDMPDTAAPDVTDPVPEPGPEENPCAGNPCEGGDMGNE